MKFLLIHGANHGAWCWDLLTPELQRLGHEAVAIDLPGHGRRVHEPASLSGYTDAITSAMGEQAVIVGHSMGGIFATLGANAAPEKVRHIIYLASALPIEGRSALEVSAGGEALSPSEDSSDTSAKRNEAPFTMAEDGSAVIFVEFEKTRSYFYGDCTIEEAKWAFDRLTPEPMGPLMEPISVPRFWRANLPRSYIQCTMDAAVLPAFADEMSFRLGVTPLTIKASHSPFLSKPRELAKVLVAAESTKPTGSLRPHG